MPSFHLLNTRWRRSRLKPAVRAASTPILLNGFFLRVFNNLLYPLHPYHRPVRPAPHFLEVLGELHFRLFRQNLPGFVSVIFLSLKAPTREPVGAVRKRAYRR